MQRTTPRAPLDLDGGRLAAAFIRDAAQIPTAHDARYAYQQAPGIVGWDGLLLDGWRPMPRH
jgi:hypothetical protein